MKIVLFGRPHIRLEIAGSTNTYARQLIEAKRPVEGTVISSSFQYSGRGQGNHGWESEAGKNLLCTYVFYPEIPVNRVFILNKMLACAVHQCLRKLTGSEEFKIKWPNDILINNNKISGMLVETGISGDKINYCIAGIGINVNQEVFRSYRPEAISIKMLTSKPMELDFVLGTLNQSLTDWYEKLITNADEVSGYYDHHLYLINQQAGFIIHGNRMNATITGTDQEGHVMVETENRDILRLKHGELQFLF